MNGSMAPSDLCATSSGRTDERSSSSPMQVSACGRCVRVLDLGCPFVLTRNASERGDRLPARGTAASAVSAPMAVVGAAPTAPAFAVDAVARKPGTTCV